jgi:hypothetical protein
MVAAPVLQQAAHGQATNAAGAIQGTITDQKGAILPGAAISITNLATGARKALVSDSSGFYSVASLDPGRYQVVVTDPGFAKVTTTLTVQIGNTSNGSLSLKVGAATEEVVVNSEALQVNTVQSTVQGVLTEQQIDNLPISGRNFLDLSQLEPGVQLQSGETFDPTKAGYSSISFNGVNGRTARIMLDGQDISDETVGTTTLNVSQGSIEEFQISRSSLDISNELTSSGAVTVSTRAGSNQFHGQGFGLFRDERSGAANSPGGNAYPFQRNQMGGRLGGPVIKDKLFFFGSAERVKQDAFNSVQFADPFSGYNGGYDAPFRDNYYVGRADYDAPKGVHTFFRIAYEDNLNDATYGYGYSRYGNKDNTPAFAGGADFITGTFTHSLRASYLKFHNMIADETASGVPVLEPGIELFQFNGATALTGPNLLAPQQTYQSDKQFRYDVGVTAKTHSINFGVSINRILGGGFASFFGFGPEVDADYTDGPVGSGLATDATAYAAEDAVLGNGEGFNTEKSEFGYPAGGQGDWRVGLYFGDNWKVRPRLTINYGVRYSHDTGRSDSDLAPIPCSDAVAQWGSSSPCTSGNLLDSILDPSSVTGAGSSLVSGNSLGYGARIREPNEDFGPKAGFAWDIKGNGKTVIRGGAGMYFENNIFNNVLFDRPTRLKSGLFFSDQYLPTGTGSFDLPGGGSFSTFGDGTTLASLWGMPISESAPYFAELGGPGGIFQTATKTAGAAANGSYVANSLTEGANGESMYVPNFRTGRSMQFNIGVQREVWKGGIVTVDYVRNVGEHIQQSLDSNHDGDASTLNPYAAEHAIRHTLEACSTHHHHVTTIDEAISSCPGLYQPDPNDTAEAYHPQVGAVIEDFAGQGLDSGNAYFGGSPAASQPLYSYKDHLGVTHYGPPKTPEQGAAFPGVNPFFGEMRFNLPLGRSVYNGLQTNLRQSARVPLPGLKRSNFEISYSLSKFVSSGGADQNFTPGSVDNNNPLGFVGPAGTDRTHQLSYGGTFEWIGGFTTGIIGHYYSALPTTLYLDDHGSQRGTAEIYRSDLTGDGTVGDILPGLKSGAFMRSVKPSDLGKVIANYNTTSAGRLTPAGQALISTTNPSTPAQPIFTYQELVALGAVTRTIAAPPSGNVGNGSVRTFDLTLSRPTHLRWLGPGTTLEPGLSAFNLFNMSNFGAETGNLAASETPNSANGTSSSLASRDQLRAGNGSGVFGQGVARVLEYQLKITF